VDLYIGVLKIPCFFVFEENQNWLFCEGFKIVKNCDIFFFDRFVAKIRENGGGDILTQNKSMCQK